MRSPVFCIGPNKSGTTSLEAFFKHHGYICGNQIRGENLIPAYARGQWEPILELASTAEFFQDVPFSTADVYPYLDQHFPEGKYILTKRKSAAVWVDSLTKFHSQKFGTGGQVPSPAELKAATYRYPGYMFESMQAIFKTPENDMYNREKLLKWYEDHLTDARKYFAGKSDFLEVDISEFEAAQKIATFVGWNRVEHPMPHLNKTEN